jgi:hypothetical protein|tara:strand:+ start:47 stop:283 length:237 start_codon:yes stop_codon:yes gene_type:complete
MEGDYQMTDKFFQFDTTPEIVRETDRAVLYRVRTGVNGNSYTHRDVWLPRSQITEVAQPPYHSTVRIPMWLARKNNIR